MVCLEVGALHDMIHSNSYINGCPVISNIDIRWEGLTTYGAISPDHFEVFGVFLLKVGEEKGHAIL